MSEIMGVIQYILDLGPSVMMPIIVFVLAMVFRMPLGRAARAAITIGAGFIAINLVIGLMVNTLGPATEAMVKNLGANLSVMDVGWPVAAAIAFGTAEVVPWVFVLGILLNIVLVIMGLTKTLDIDMWNYWHFIFTAAFVYVITDSLPIAVGLALLTELVVLKLADYTAPIVQEYYGLRGISLPHTETVSWAPVGWVLNKLIDRIPWLRNLHADPESVQRRFGIIGEPIVLGTVLGLVIAVLGFYPEFNRDFGGSLAKTLTTAVTMGAVMLVLPRMVAILMEGLVPLSDGAREFLNRRFSGRELWLGMDAAIVVGFTNNMAVGLILIPITIFLAIGMSFIGLNSMIPFTDLAVLPFFAIWTNTWSRGNIVRGVIIGTIFMAVMLSIGTFLAPMTTELASMANFDVPEGALQISSIDSGAHLLPWALVFPFAIKDIQQFGVAFTVWSVVILLGTILSYAIFVAHCWRGRHVPGIEDREVYMSVGTTDGGMSEQI